MTEKEIIKAADKISEKLKEYRRYLHRNAETGFELYKTSAFVKEKLNSLGYKTEDCGRCGVTATVGNGQGKTILLRSDMDALPIMEETGLDYASENGNMHACGHDMHTAMLLGAAEILKDKCNSLMGRVKFMFQPAEELLMGAKEMIENNVLENPSVDGGIMMHVLSAVPFKSGTVIVSSPGVSAPAADYFTIEIEGKGCHGASPEKGVDPINVASHILIALQEISARELAASDEAVLTIGKLTAGSAANVIADTAVLEGTVRSFDQKLQDKLKTRITDICMFVSAAFRAKVKVKFTMGCPALLNNAKMSELVFKYTEELLGENVITTAMLNPGGAPARGGGSEDFAYISQKVPSVMIALCAGETEKGYKIPAHNPKVLFDEDVLKTGSAVLAYAALRLLEK